MPGFPSNWSPLRLLWLALITCTTGAWHCRLWYRHTHLAHPFKWLGSDGLSAWSSKGVFFLTQRAGFTIPPPPPPSSPTPSAALPSSVFYRQTCHDVWYEEFASEVLFNNQPVFVVSPGSLLGFTEGNLLLDFLKSPALKLSDTDNLWLNL